MNGSFIDNQRTPPTYELMAHRGSSYFFRFFLLPPHSKRANTITKLLNESRFRRRNCVTRGTKSGKQIDPRTERTEVVETRYFCAFTAKYCVSVASMLNNIIACLAPYMCSSFDRTLQGYHPTLRFFLS